MSDLTVFKRTDEPGPIYDGIPDRDISQRDWDGLSPKQRRTVTHSPLFATVPSEDALDPLGELDNAAFERLSPAEKGARTKEANRRAEQIEADRLEANRRAEQIEADRLEAAALAAAEQQAAVTQLTGSIDALQDVLDAGEAGEGDNE